MIPKPSTCKECPLFSEYGFSRPDGLGNKGVLIVAEALGKEEAEAGIPLVGTTGHFLFTKLAGVGLERDDFTLFNVIACRPPDNKLAGMPYEDGAIKHCAPNLDKVITEARSKAISNGQTFTILCLGKIAFKRIMGLTDRHPIMTHDYKFYPFWNEAYQAWVIGADHPAFLMRGQTHLIPTLQFAASRAVEIATNGMSIVPPVYLEDPDPALFKQWIDDYFKALDAAPTETYLSYDIETPMKQGKDEEEVAKEDDDDYTILRCSFAYRPEYAVSVPWRAEYLPQLERLFAAEAPMVGWNNSSYDFPRVAAQLTVKGDQIDAMLAWHVLNSALPKGLGFVTAFYVPDASVWKHLSDKQPAFYNAKDADMALRNWLGIRKDLKESKLGEVFDRHVIEINRVFNYMSDQGVLIDKVARKEGEERVAALLNDLKEQIKAVVPQEAQTLKIYKKTPKDTTGLIETVSTVKVTECPNCGVQRVKADHYKSIGKKALKLGHEENPCVGLKSKKVDIISSLWAIPLEFKISNLSMQRYQAVKKHKPIIDPKKKTITFDEKAITRLQKKYKDDPLYPLIIDFRGTQKLLSTYIGVTNEAGIIKGGMPFGPDGRIHTRFTHNPSTLRSASQGPNLQNLPRPGKPDGLASIIRNLIIAQPGSILYACDFSGIEAVLVGYFAMAPGYIRLARRDVHSFYTVYAIHELDPGRVSANDLPLLSWEDEKLFARLTEIKQEFKHDRNSLYKHLVHGANFAQSPKGAAEKIYSETGVEYDVSLVKRVMDIYFELFPEIKKWHSSVLYQADKDGYVRNPFGYIHRFSKVYDWEKVGGVWQKEPGPDANKVIAFGPQSTAAGIIKEAMLRLFFERFEEAGQYLRLLVHDELFFEVPLDKLEQLDKVVKEEMERPIPQLALPKSYGMGEALAILTEEKVGLRWGSMR